jgi:predicted Ser/Thr protein kinase
MFFTTGESHLLDCNPALMALLGYASKDEILHLDLARDFFFSPQDYEHFQELVQKENLVHHFKINLKSKEGQKITVLVSGHVMRGQPQRMIGYASLDLAESEESILPPSQASPLVGRPAVKKSLLDLINRLLPFAGNFLSVLKLTELLGGRYEKIKKLGQGSFGEVWLVQDTEDVAAQRFYVAKIPYSRNYNRSMKKEADICQKLAPHAGAVGLVDSFEEAGKLILIQEYVVGQTLQDLLVEELPDNLKERIILKLIDIVAHAHQHNIIHRDIKPNNIIVGPGDIVKLLDYGAAKDLKDRDISATMIGSRPYMAPEQIMGQSQRRSDIWALGVIMYLLYTGLLPFYDDSEKVLIDLILETEPTPPQEENPEISPELAEIIMKCLKKKVEERYPQAGSLKEDLLRFFPGFGQHPIEELPETPAG